MTRETMYVALTRARAGGQLYLAAEDRKDALTQLRDTPTRQGEQLAALDVLAGHLDTRRTDRDRSPRPKPVHGHPAGVSPQPTRPGRPDRAARDAAPTAGRASDPETAAVPHWQHHPAGGLAPAQLTAGIDDAQARDQQQAAQATRRRAEADQLGAVLGTADSPARRAQARRWEQLRTAEAHLTVADQHASLSQHARRQANPARNEAEEATRLLGHHDCAGSAVPRHQPARVA